MPKHSKDNSRLKLKKASERQRAKPIPLKSETEEPTDDIFENMCIYIHPENINGSRLNVLRSLVIKKGGSFTLEPNEETTHILVDESISSAKLCRALGWATYPPQVNVLLVGWLSASIGANRCLELEDYEIPCTHRPTFVVEQQHVDAIEENEEIRNEENGEIRNEGNEENEINNENGDVPSDVTKDCESGSETVSFDSVAADVTTYDDGKYEDETSCDDDWIRISPLVPVVPLYDQITLSPFTDFKSNLQIHASNSSSNEKPNVAPVQRPNTLAARLSRVRVRRIPEHLRVPGGSSIIVELNNENYPEEVSHEPTTAEASKQIVERDTNFKSNETQTSYVDEKNKLLEPEHTPSQEVAVATEKEIEDEEMRRGAKRSWSSLTSEQTFSECSLTTYYENKKSGTGPIVEVSESKLNRKASVNVFSPEKNFDLSSVNEVNQVLKMMVESVFEGAVSGQVINRPYEVFTQEHQEEKTVEEVVSEVLLGVILEVSSVVDKTCTEDQDIKCVSKIENLYEWQIPDVKCKGENIMNVSEPKVSNKNEIKLPGGTWGKNTLHFFQDTNSLGIEVVGVETLDRSAINISDPEAENKNETKIVSTKTTDENITAIVQPTATNKNEIKVTGVETLDGNHMLVLKSAEINMNEIRGSNIEAVDESKMDICLDKITSESETKIGSIEAVVENNMNISSLEATHGNEIKTGCMETMNENKMDISVSEVQTGIEVHIASVTVDESKKDVSLSEATHENKIASFETLDKNKKLVSMHEATNGDESKTVDENKNDISMSEATNGNESKTLDENKKDISMPEATNGNESKTVDENKKDISMPEATIGNENKTMVESKKDISLPEATNGNENKTMDESKDISFPNSANENKNKISSIETVDNNQMDISLPETTGENKVKTAFVESMSKSAISISQNKVAIEPSSSKGMDIKDKSSAKRLKFDINNAKLSVLQSSQSSTVPTAPPYPMHVYCSVEGESPVPPCLPNDEMNFKLEERKLSKTESPHNENRNNMAKSEVANDKNGSISIDIQSKELKKRSERRSCSRPDIRGPNIFFPFPIPKPSATQTSGNPGSSNESSDPKYFLYSDSPNVDTIKKLQFLHDGFKNCKDTWRVHAYDRAISLLGRYPKEIESLEEVLSIGNMSKKIAKKIWHIKQTGDLQEIEDVCNKRWPEARKLLTKAWGISPRIAFRLYKEGNVTIQDVHNKSFILSRIQRVGLRYYRDLRTKMSKEEATTILSTVMRIIFDMSTGVQCDACTSLRRKKNVISNVSILVTLPQGCQNTHRLLPDVVAKLHRLGYIADDIIRHQQKGNQTKYVGIFRLNKSSKYRRLDITVCPENEHACAIMFLTGTSYFNRAIRQWAARKEMILDEHSLRIRLLNIEGGTSAVTRLYTPDEASIFRYLQLPYRTPEQRDRIII